MLKRTFLVGVIAVGTLLGTQSATADPLQPVSTTAEQPTQPSCEASTLIVAQAEGAQGEKPSGEIEERGVPRMGPGGMAPGKMPGKIEGAILESNRLRAQPGYVLQPQADGSVMLRQANGAGGGTFSCYCASGKGGCDMVVRGGEAWCYKSDNNPCKTCNMKLSATSGGMLMQ